MRTDLEGPNPGIVTVGRPNILGFMYAMKSGGVTQFCIRFIVERNVAVDEVLKRGKVHQLGRSRNIRVWEKHQPAKVCDNLKCLQIGYFQAVCGFSARSRSYFGDHVPSHHMCCELNCDGETSFACRHAIRRCLLCDKSNHFLGYR